MRMVFITPCKDCILAEIREKASPSLNNYIRQNNAWIKWEQKQDVNGKGRLQWYIVVNTSAYKDIRASSFASVICEKEGFSPSSRICPHDLYYEDFVKYFSKYQGI